MARSLPRLVVAGLSGDSGKTLVSLSLTAALRRKGFSVSVFKKGPDYIDSAWLSWASQSGCRNLDTYLVDPDDVLETFIVNATGSDISVVEGNRGLFDGKDSSGTHSTAELATLLQAPVVLVVNTAKVTRTIAAVVNGCHAFDPNLKLAGIILNNVAGKRHQAVITDSIERHCSVPVLGTVPRLDAQSDLIPNRHLGLVPPSEYSPGSHLESRLAGIAQERLDLDALVKLAGSAQPLQAPDREPTANVPIKARIGYFRDSVFTFYYPENLEALKASGAELVPVSSLEDSSLPDVDALYIGGGFPETRAERLTENQPMLKSVLAAAMGGLPIYAECGGLIYLSRSVAFNGKRYPMAEVFDVDLNMESKPVGHGYSLVRIDRANPFFEVGTDIRGHEFHYSGPVAAPPQEQSCMSVKKGVGLGNGRDGLIRYNTLACYTHIHARSVKSWASSIVACAVNRKRRGTGITTTV